MATGRSLLCLLALLPAPHDSRAQVDSTWRDHDRAARTAREHGDWAGARLHLRKVDSLLPGHPRVALALARVSAHLGDTAAALAMLERLVRMGLVHDLASDTELVLLRGDARAALLARRFAANAARAGSYSVAVTLPSADFVAEGIGYDPRRKQFLISSIRFGKVVAVDSRGATRDFADLVHDGAWSGLGLAVDFVRDRLWIATSWMPLTAGAAPGDSGRAGVVSYELSSHTLLRRLELPRGGHEPGDICLSPNGDLFVSDGRAGVIYLARAEADSLETWLPRGSLVSPQGCAVDPAGERLFVADYALGIAVVRLADRSLAWLTRPPDLALNGIDGLALSGGGNRLIGVQNGVEPNRVIGLDLDRSGRAIIAARVLAQDTARIREPTHLTIIGNSAFFIANGGFGMYDGSGRLRAGARPEPPRIGRLELRGYPVTKRADTARTKAALLAADAALARAIARGGSAALLNAATADAAMLFPGQPILPVGTARRAYLARYPTRASYTWRAVHAVAGSDGTFGCTLGFSRYLSTNDTLRTGGGRLGSYITCWQRRGLGRWRIVAQQRNDSTSLAVPFEELALPAAPHSASVAFSGSPAGEARDADAAFALLASAAAGPGPAFAGFIAEDGLLLGGAKFPRGPGGAEQAFAGFPAARLLSWQPRQEFGAGSGGLAVTVGHSTTRSRADSAAAETHGKYLTVWRQREDGRWEFILDLGSPRP